MPHNLAFTFFFLLLFVSSEREVKILEGSQFGSFTGSFQDLSRLSFQGEIVALFGHCPISNIHCLIVWQLTLE